MTTVDATWTRPRLRDGVALGPGQWRGEKLIHHVRDAETGWFYRVGPREHFLLSRMDGTRTLDDIAVEYAATYQRRLGPENWQQLFGMLHRRQLLDGATDPEAIARLTASAAEGAAKARRGPLSARWPLFDPDTLFTWLLPRIGPLFSWWFVLPALLAALVVTGYVGANLPDLLAGTGGGHRPLAAIMAAVVISWLIILLHECAHGLTCRHFGGRVSEIGVMWRFPLLAPYCKVDDIVLFTPRRRVATAFAGVFVSMLALVPFAVIRAVAEPGVLHDLAGAMLLFGTATVALNLVPFLRLDGYHMLGHALNLADLRADTYRFWGRLLRGGRRATADYRRRERLIYTGYGVASVVFVATVLTLLIRFWYGSLAGWIGPGWAVTVLVAEAVVLLALAGHLARRRRAATADEARGSDT
ncbi:hypothetical protein ACFY2Q_22120 [Micromonospora sp. NPDC000316]|uniref:hypothetical protein n=1 Tax=Micromonospora sp. NPDC000316 TaxID=3364216 RepID=UPI00367544F2